MTAGPESLRLFEEASEVLPGGVDSPVRAFGSVGGHPPFIVAGAGARVTDADGRQYIDLVSTWGATILGHADAELVAAVSAAAARGLAFGAPHPDEAGLARRIREAMPGLEMVRFVTSGTEAVMSALRLARAATGRDLVIKFDGCYHGHSDGLLVAAGSGLTTLGLAASPGVPAAVAATTISLPFNDVESLGSAFAAHGDSVAAVIVEGVPCNMGVVPPEPGFLERIRALCTQYGALLVLDEVITGFRLGRGGAQEMLGIHPDLTCLGKVIGGGLPVGAYAGPRSLMEMVAPAGPVYQAGTLAGSPVAMAAGITVLDRLAAGEVHAQLTEAAAQLQAGLEGAITATGARARVARSGSLLTLFFANAPVRDHASALACDTGAHARFHREMLGHGILLPPSQFEGWFLNVGHDHAVIDEVVTEAASALAAVTQSG